jgi:hypothetical protein
MKRIILSILGGIIFPIGYLAAALTVVWLLPQYHLLDSTELNGKSMPGLIFLPVSLPIYIYEYFGWEAYEYPAKNAIWLGLVWFLAFNFIFYSGLFYSLLRMFSLLKEQRAENSETPPPPPQF